MHALSEQVTMDFIEWPRVQRVLDECPVLDEYESYYRQFSVPRRVFAPLVPQTLDVLRSCLSPDMLVLDVGCGRGDTLLDLATAFRWGMGIDESPDVMLAQAKTARSARAIANVDFCAAKAAALPFEQETFDLVFSERGPLGYNDVTLQETLRVLRPGGLIFIEMVGELNSWETRVAFEPDYEKPPALAGLEIEGDRLVRHDVRLHTLASRLQSAEFDSMEDWLRYQLFSWSPPSRDAFTEERLDAIHRFQRIASVGAGRISITGHTLWVAGTKRS
jgi:SAM-dependent methyltransferase